MFLSIHSRDFVLNPKTQDGLWTYKIVDTDWEKIDVVAAHGFGVWVAAAIINTYSKLGLPVAANIIRGFQWDHREHGWSIKQNIAWNKTNNSKYFQYQDEIEKYLILL